MNFKKNLLLLFILINKNFSIYLLFNKGYKSDKKYMELKLSIIKEFTHTFIDNLNPLLSSQIINNSYNDDDNNEINNNNLYSSQIKKKKIDDKTLLGELLKLRKKRIYLLFNNLKELNQINKNQVEIFSSSLDFYENNKNGKTFYLKSKEETLFFYDNTYNQLKKIERENKIRNDIKYNIYGSPYKAYVKNSNAVINKIKSVNDYFNINNAVIFSDEQYEYIKNKEIKNKLKINNGLNKPYNNYNNSSSYLDSLLFSGFAGILPTDYK